MSILQEICDKKRVHVQTVKAHRSLSDLRLNIKKQSEPLKFINKIKANKNTAIITEVKKASPSKGVIRNDFDPVQIANTYAENGGTCLSILTDTPYFQGQDQYLRDIKAHCSLPALRKDFMVDLYQIYESRAMGADCVLLIMAALTDSEARDMYACATDLGMDVLVEVHDQQELERAIALNPRMIGVNNRNLKTLNVDIQTSFDLLQYIPDTVVKIAESGIKTRETITALETAGYNGFLIGESLMRQEDIGDALNKLLGNT